MTFLFDARFNGLDSSRIRVSVYSIHFNFFVLFPLLLYYLPVPYSPVMSVLKRSSSCSSEIVNPPQFIFHLTSESMWHSLDAVQFRDMHASHHPLHVGDPHNLLFYSALEFVSSAAAMGRMWHICVAFHCLQVDFPIVCYYCELEYGKTLGRLCKVMMGSFLSKWVQRWPPCVFLLVTSFAKHFQICLHDYGSDLFTHRPTREYLQGGTASKHL